MASFLESQLRNAIAKGFKGRLLVGTLSRVVNGDVDEYGDPVETFVEYRMEGFEDEYSDFYRASVGIPETTVKLVFIAGNSATVPQKNDRVVFRTGKYKIDAVKTDPALATYECQSTRVYD